MEGDPKSNDDHILHETVQGWQRTFSKSLFLKGSGNRQLRSLILLGVFLLNVLGCEMFQNLLPFKFNKRKVY